MKQSGGKAGKSEHIKMYIDINTINKYRQMRKTFATSIAELILPIYKMFLIYEKKNPNTVHKHARNTSRQFTETKMHIVLKQMK